MIEVYGFLVLFLAQVLALSVLYPARFSQYVRRHAQSVPQERLAKLYPGVDLVQARERFLRQFRGVNGAIAILGLGLLAWLANYMQNPQWNDSVVIMLCSLYCVVQYLPLFFMAWLGFKFNRTLRQSMLEARRTATLQRRGLFDYISPLPVFLAAGGFLAIFPFVILVQDKPFPGLALLGVLTLTWLSQCWVIYKALYGKKANPLEPPDLREERISKTVKSGVYGLIMVTVFFAFVFAVDMLDMKRWVPVAQTFCLLMSSLLCLMVVGSPRRESDPDAPAPAPSASHH